MDFELDDMQSMLIDSVEKFVANDYNFETRMAASERDGSYSKDIWARFAELGWTAIPFSEEAGGIGGGPIEVALFMEQYGRGLFVEPWLANVVLAGGMLDRLADGEQRARWLEPMIAGDLQCALAWVEPHSRYDLSAIATTAESDGNGWRISGSKSVVFNGGNADVLFMLARCADGIGCFAIDARADGLVRRSYRTVDGCNASELTLDAVSVSSDARLGGPDDTAAAYDAVVDLATLAVGAEATGIMQTLTAKTVEYSKSRVQFGVPIGSFQALQHRMVDMFTQCEQARSLMLRAAMRAAAGEDASVDISALKYFVGTAGRTVGEEAVQLHGGMGVTWELDVAHYFKRLTVINQVLGNADWHLDRLAGAGQ